MKNIIIAFVLVFSGILAHSQEISVTNTPETDNPDPTNFWTKKLGTDESGHYLLREYGPVSNKVVILEKYDLDFTLQYSKNIESTSGILGDSKNHIKTIFTKDHVLAVLASWKKETAQSGLWVQPYSKDGEKVGEPTMLVTEENTTFLKSSSYKLSVSPDGSKIAVLRQPTFDKTAKESFELLVLNSADFSLISSNEFTFPTAMKRYPRNEVKVNNNGVAFAFKKVKVSGKEFKYYLVSLGKASKFQEELEFGLDQVNQTKFIINKQGELVAMGFLSELKKSITLWQKNMDFKS